MKTRIHKLGDFPTDPDLMLKMVLANVDNKKSVLISIIAEDDDGDEIQHTYYTPMKAPAMAYHSMCLDHATRREILDHWGEEPDY